MKSIVFILLAAILISLGSGLYYLSSKNHDSKKIQYALRIRIVLSVILVLFLVVSYLTGWIEP
jgi:predicted permease